MTEKEHRERFPPPRLSGGCGFRIGPLLPTIRPRKTFGSGSQPGAVLCAVKDDERVYRLHSLTRRQHHQRVDVQLCQVSFDVHGEVGHAHQGIRERLEVRRRPSAKALRATGLP